MLADIELAQTLKSETEKAQEEMIETVPHPLDQDYNSLRCLLTLLDTKTETFKVESNTKLTYGHDIFHLCRSSALHGGLVLSPAERASGIGHLTDVFFNVSFSSTFL